MHRFKVGDKVVRTDPDFVDAENVPVGTTLMVKRLLGDHDFLAVGHGSWIYLGRTFELCNRPSHQPHVHHDIIIEWARGCQVQRLTPNQGWKDWDEPRWCADQKYRIKPAKLTRLEKHLDKVRAEIDSLTKG